jgi:hypothetical protein
MNIDEELDSEFKVTRGNEFSDLLNNLMNYDLSLLIRSNLRTRYDGEMGAD